MWCESQTKESPRAARSASIRASRSPRLLYAVSGLAWPNPAHISYSIVPDGVSWDHGTNDVNATLDAQLGIGSWERELARALQTWASVANINIARAPMRTYRSMHPVSRRAMLEWAISASAGTRSPTGTSWLKPTFRLRPE